MRAIRCLTLLLALFAPTAFAEGVYQVEMILVRQNSVPAFTSPFAPEDWSAGAPRLDNAAERPLGLDDETTRLQATADYTVLASRYGLAPDDRLGIKEAATRELIAFVEQVPQVAPSPGPAKAARRGKGCLWR